MVDTNNGTPTYLMGLFAGQIKPGLPGLPEANNN